MLIPVLGDTRFFMVTEESGTNELTKRDLISIFCASQLNVCSPFFVTVLLEHSCARMYISPSLIYTVYFVMLYIYSIDLNVCCLSLCVSTLIVK